jgi:hypothetical protein
MKLNYWILGSVALFAAACGTTFEEISPTPTEILFPTTVAAPAKTQTQIAKRTSPTLTSEPVTLSTPTIWTDTPDPSATSTASPTAISGPMIPFTPAPPANCPESKAGLSIEAPDVEDPAEGMRQILDFLNLGGFVEVLDSALRKKTDEASYNRFRGKAQTIEDLTNDGVPEIILNTRHGSNETLYILQCKAGLYEVVYEERWQVGDFYILNFSVQDINGNGINELISDVSGGHGAYHWQGKDIYEWNGRTFVEVLETPGLNVRVTVEFTDQDGNGSKEVMVTLGPPFECVVDPPWWPPFRKEIYTFAWNGFQYIQIGREFAPPEYRFQAVYAGDDASLEGDYKAALAYYQQAIFDETLKWGSAELWQYRQDSCSWMGEFTPPPPPEPDPNERPNLSAYSRYRIMLVHILTQNISAAQVVYDTLQSMFPQGAIGYPYAALANAFWMEYQRNGEMSEACLKAIEYASQNEEQILGPIDDPYWVRDRWYEPDDICPFNQ